MIRAKRVIVIELEYNPNLTLGDELEAAQRSSLGEARRLGREITALAKDHVEGVYDATLLDVKNKLVLEIEEVEGDAS